MIKISTLGLENVGVGMEGKDGINGLGAPWDTHGGRQVSGGSQVICRLYRTGRGRSFVYGIGMGPASESASASA